MYSAQILVEKFIKLILLQILIKNEVKAQSNQKLLVFECLFLFWW